MIVSIDEDEMAKRSKNSTVAIQNLLDEKSEIERWLRRLDMAGDKTPDHVRSKVQTDYARRLESVLEELQGYRAEPGVDPASDTATFAAMRLYVDNWRWQGVPFYIRSGKRLKQRSSEVMIQFKLAQPR